jgi:hypothetical protein
MNALKIILFSTLLAILYGIVHDLITAHICVEYFTIGHPKIIESTSPVTLALLWGIIATWWVGLPLGIVLALVTQFGSRTVAPVNTVLKYSVYLILCMFLTAGIFGLIAGIAATKGNLFLTGEMEQMVPKNQHIRFLAVAWTHGASYLAGITGTIVLSRVLYMKRKQL